MIKISQEIEATVRACIRRYNLGVTFLESGKPSFICNETRLLIHDNKFRCDLANDLPDYHPFLSKREAREIAALACSAIQKSCAERIRAGEVTFVVEDDKEIYL